MSPGRDFLATVFRGGRFEGASLPVDVLPDLAAYQDLLIELAKHLFLLREPTRKRVPKGFVESFQIGIRAIEAGSTTAVLNRVSPVPPMVELFPRTDLFEQARDLIDRVVEAAGAKAPLPSEFPPHLAKRFNQFGRGLRDDEYVELRRPGEPKGPRYDRAIRKWIVVQQEGRYEDSVDIHGWVSGGVIDREQITIKLEGDVLVDGRCSAALVRQTLPLVEQRVRVLGVGSFDRHDRLERILRVDDVIAVEDEEGASSNPSSLEDQFSDLASLRAGWFEPETPPLDPRGLDAVRDFLTAVTALGVPVPHMYPTPDGEARGEWSCSDWEVSATFDLKVLSVRLHATHLHSDSSEEHLLTLAASDAPEAFAAFRTSFYTAKSILPL
jgi:hypothetical protein